MSSCVYLDRMEENLVPYSLKLRTKIGAEIAEPPASAHHYQDTFTPPLLDFNLRIRWTTPAQRQATSRCGV